ncbi:hypothetical protein [Streptomyces sp. NPDC008121]|uniref:hypothetical protein n=1 Tax=Streptomyces sp. NPDC008121 TaxID=3364809 RepID=UPI0036E56A50
MSITACSSTSAPTPHAAGIPPALHAQLRRGLEQSSSDFERRVFADAIKRGGITQKQYDQAFAMYRKCVSTAGVEEVYQRMPSGIYRVISNSAETASQIKTAEKIVRSCADGSTMRIEAVYRMQLFNPTGEKDLLKLAVQCLIKEKVVTPGYTAEQLRRELRRIGSEPAENEADRVRTGKAVECLYNFGFAV